MASTVVVRGLLRIGAQASESTPTYNAARNIQTKSIDDSSVAFAQSHTALNTGGAVANEFFQSFDATPTESTTTTSATISHVTTYGTANGNFTVRRIALHDDLSSTTTDATATLVAGVDAQSLAKTTDFTLAITVRLKYVVC